MSAVVAAFAVAAIGTGYAIYSNEEAKKEADRATKKKMEANTRTAEAEADRIRFSADKLKKAQRAGAAKAGLVINVGTALDVQKETDLLAGKDIQSVMETRDVRNQGALSEAKMFKMGWDASSVSSVLNFGQTALGAYGQQNKNNNFIVQQETANKPVFLGSSMFKDTSKNQWMLR